MAIGLTHLGEAIVQRMIELRPNRFLELCERPQTGVHGGRVFREVELQPHGGRRFDGASRVDLVVPLSETEALPVEVKLGEARLSKSRVDSEWLAGCGTSPQDTAWTGNMMSVLDGLFPTPASSGRLVARVVAVGDYTLTQSWFVVVRRRTADKWQGVGRPKFLHAKIVVFDDLAEEFQPAEFDSIVKEILSFPYYDTWINAV